MSRQVIIIGAGGVGREIAATLKNSAFSDVEVLGFVDDKAEQGSIISSLKVLGNLKWLINLRYNTDCGVIVAIGNPQVRKNIIGQLGDDFYYPTLIHPNASIHSEATVAIGKGCYIADGCILTTDIVIEDFCFINTGCTLQHDTFIKRNSVLMPGVRITGGATIGSNTFIAAGCVITTAVLIEENSVINDSIK